MRIDPTASQALLPVTTAITIAPRASTRPMRAAESSSSTTGSSGDLACLTNFTQDWPRVREWFDSFTAVRRENDSSMIEMSSTTMGMPGRVRSSWCCSFS